MEDLSEYGKELYKLLKSDDHILAAYIKAIDENLDDNSVLISIADRIGIFIQDNENAFEILYFGLKEYLLLEKDPKVTEKIVNMTFEEFRKEHSNLPEEHVELLFSNRLLN